MNDGLINIPPVSSDPNEETQQLALRFLLQRRMLIPHADFAALVEDLTTNPLPMNAYRKTAGSGRSQTFGVVNRRCLPPDYSRQNWWRPKTLYLLKEFADKWVDISWNAVTVNVDYQAAPHRDKHNRGVSFLVAFGSYTGGDLVIHEGDLSGSHSIWCSPIKTDFSKVLHSVQPFTGNRFSLVFYEYDLKETVLPPWSVTNETGDYRFYRDGIPITKKEGLPHPLKGRKSKS